MKAHTNVYWRPSRKSITEEELMAFARRLHARMTELGMTQSDLARKAFGVIEVDGVERARDRDKISLYMRGKGLPGEDKMRAIANALGMPLEKLAPMPPDEPLVTREAAREAATMHTAFVEPYALPSGEAYAIRSVGKGMVILSVSQKLRAEDAARILGEIAEAAQHAK